MAKPLQETNLNNYQPACHYVKQMAIQRGAVFQAPLQALQELALLAHPATEAKVVTREGVDQHLDAQRQLLDWPHLKEYLLQPFLLAHLGKLLGWNRIGKTCLYTLEPSLLSSLVPSNKKFQTISQSFGSESRKGKV